MNLFLNGIAATAGGGLTYLRNVVPQLATRAHVKTTLAVHPLLRNEFGHQPNISLLETTAPGGAARRYWWEQTVLPQLIRDSCAEVLISAGNFALRSSPVPQILLSRNSLYTCPDFFRDLRRRREYARWLDVSMQAVLAKRSLHWADRTVAPSKAFASELFDWTGVKPEVIYHGFDSDAFFRDTFPLEAATQQKFDTVHDSVKLLLVSNYTYYRNFETLIRALPILKHALAPRRVRLFLTCELSSENSGNYDGRMAANLVRELGLTEEVVELGAIRYGSLHYIYRACDIYVNPAYAETFAHPLVEAMACGIPIVASDLPVHREVCGPAGLYFERFSPRELAGRVMEIVASPGLAAKLAVSGGRRASSFSWSKHVTQLLSLASSVLVDMA
jgi:glycosyltransferase involved in cell wall biosynthesis